MNAIYGGIVGDAHLVSLRLVSSEFIVNPDFIRKGSADSFEVETEWTEDVHGAERETVMGVCDWTFRGLAASEEKPLVEVQAQYLILYHHVGPNPEVALAFLHDVGRMATYPYFRSQVAMFAGAAQILLPPLPTITVGTFQNRSKLTSVVAVPSTPETTGTE